jgi:hypothetical protein
MVIFCMFEYSDVQHFVLSHVFPCWVQYCDVHYEFSIKQCSLARGRISYLHYLCLLAHSGVQHEQHIGCFMRGRHCLSFAGAWVHPRVLVKFVLVIVLVFCVVFIVLLVFVLCTLCCQFLWIGHSWLSLRFSLTFIYNLSLCGRQ